MKLADLFVQYGQDATVERMMYEMAQQERYTITSEWLKNHFLAKNNLAATLEMAQLIFRKRPTFAEYEKMTDSLKKADFVRQRSSFNLFLRG